MRHDAPIFAKITFNVSGEKDSGHIKYIGSRPGVEKKIIESDLAHIGYAGSRPRSTGLFGPDPAQQPTIKEAQTIAAAREKQLSWRLIISLKEADAQKLGYVGREAWEELTRKNMLQFARALGLNPTDVKWVAAHHPEQGHPHVHVLAYLSDRAPSRRGQLTSMELREFRQGVARECFGPLRQMMAVERTLARNSLIETARTNISAISTLERRAVLAMQVADPIGTRLPPTFSTQDLGTLGHKLSELATLMPGTGRAALQFMPPNVKRQARETADWLLSRPQLSEVLQQYESATREITRTYTTDSNRSREAWERAYNDLRDRVANSVIKEAAQINRAARQKAIDHQVVASKSIQTVFKTLDRERLRAEAQAELASLEAMERAEQKNREERGYDRYF